MVEYVSEYKQQKSFRNDNKYFIHWNEMALNVKTRR